MRRERATGSSAAPKTERLDIVPTQFWVIVTIRPKYACRTCTNGVTQAPALAHLIEGALPTEAMIAHVLVAKYADHCPLYRQAQVYARAGLALDRSTLAGWVGRAAFHLTPVVDRLAAHLKGSGKLFMDETPAPVLDPGRGKTRTGYLWALARDDRPWGGTDPPGVVYFHAPGRGGGHAEAILAVQAAVAGQGVVLGSLPSLRSLVAANLLVTPISERVATDIGYDLMTTERALARSAVAAFVDWTIEQARAE